MISHSNSVLLNILKIQNFDISIIYYVILIVLIEALHIHIFYPHPMTLDLVPGKRSSINGMLLTHPICYSPNKKIGIRKVSLR